MVENGADVSCTTTKGYLIDSLLVMASRRDNVELVKYLITKGADVNDSGRAYNSNDNRYIRFTPLDCAKSEEVRAVLRAAGGKTREELKWE